MQKYPSVDSDVGETFDRPLFARHRDVPHALAGLGTEAGGDQFVVAPHCAVEEYQRGAVEPRFQLVIDVGAGGEEIEMLVRGLVEDAKAERVAGSVVAAGMRLALQIPGALAGDGEGQDFDAG